MRGNCRHCSQFIVLLLRFLTRQQHSFFPHHCVKAFRKGLDEVVGVGHSGGAVDVLCGHGVRVRSAVRNVLPDGAGKQDWLLETRKDIGSSILL